jgi:hypothetical protein
MAKKKSPKTNKPKPRRRKKAASDIKEAVGVTQPIKKKKSSGLRPIRKPAGMPKRNGLCPCGSGVKYKKCHGKPVDTPMKFTAGYQTFRSQYSPEQLELELKFIEQWGFSPSLSQLQIFADGDIERLKSIVCLGLRNAGNAEKYAKAVDRLGFLITPKNQTMVSLAAKTAWDEALKEFEDEDEEAAGSEAGDDQPVDA